MKLLYFFFFFLHYLLYPVTNCNNTIIVENLCLQQTLTQMKGRLWCLSWRSWVTWATTRTLWTCWEPAPTEVSQHPDSALLLSEYKRKLRGLSQASLREKAPWLASVGCPRRVVTACSLLRTSAGDHRVLQPGWPLELSSPEGGDVCKLGYEYFRDHGELQWLQKHLQPEVVY